MRCHAFQNVYESSPISGSLNFGLLQKPDNFCSEPNPNTKFTISPTNPKKEEG